MNCRELSKPKPWAPERPLAPLPARTLRCRGQREAKGHLPSSLTRATTAADIQKTAPPPLPHFLHEQFDETSPRGALDRTETVHFLHEQFDETSPRGALDRTETVQTKIARGPGGAQFSGAMFWGWRTGRRALGWPSTGVHVAASNGTNARRTESEGGLYRGGSSNLPPPQ